MFEVYRVGTSESTLQYSMMDQEKYVHCFLMFLMLINSIFGKMLNLIPKMELGILTSIMCFGIYLAFFKGIRCFIAIILPLCEFFLTATDWTVWPLSELSYFKYTVLRFTILILYTLWITKGKEAFAVQEPAAENLDIQAIGNEPAAWG